MRHVLVGALGAIVIVAIVSHFYVWKEPWMITATTTQVTGIAIQEQADGSQKWYIVPVRCVGDDLHIISGCEKYAIEMPVGIP